MNQYICPLYLESCVLNEYLIFVKNIIRALKVKFSDVQLQSHFFFQNLKQIIRIYLKKLNVIDQFHPSSFSQAFIFLSLCKSRFLVFLFLSFTDGPSKLHSFSEKLCGMDSSIFFFPSGGMLIISFQKTKFITINPRCNPLFLIN